MMPEQPRRTVLIVDDTDVNREILSDILSTDYDIIEARNGIEAIDVMRRKEGELSLILLDIVMPEMDGFEVLAYMRKNHWIEDVPVIVISAETSPAYMKKGFELGVNDYVHRPFDEEVVLRRAQNAINLYAKQGRLKDLFVHSIEQQERRESLMVDILSSIVEFRNGESGLHVMRVRIISEILLEAISKRFPQYGITPSRINVISMAAALHDIGKIALPGSILNKPGRFTDEEYEVMKTHTVIGDEILKGLAQGADEELVQCARSICRWHHERWDGKGYPDGLVGDAIPIEAQVVALADVYDALVSKRVYKDAFTHDDAVRTIAAGGCGSFNPQLLECFIDEAQHLDDMISLRSDHSFEQRSVGERVHESLKNIDPGIVDRTPSLLNSEREKVSFLGTETNGLVLDYDVESDTLELYGSLREKLCYPATVPDVREAVRDWAGISPLAAGIEELLGQATAEKPDIWADIELLGSNGVTVPCRLHARAIWRGAGEGARLMGAIGHAVPSRASGQAEGLL